MKELQGEGDLSVRRPLSVCSRQARAEGKRYTRYNRYRYEFKSRHELCCGSGSVLDPLSGTNVKKSDKIEAKGVSYEHEHHSDPLTKVLLVFFCS